MNHRLLIAAQALLTFTLGSPNADAALVGRDITGKAVDPSSASSVFLYDADYDVTWYQNAGASPRSDIGDILSWAATLQVGSFDDWRLPTAYDRGTTNLCTGFNCTLSELGHLWYVELGNVASTAAVNAGPFRNFRTFANTSFPAYWTSTIYAPNPSFAYRFGSQSGSQDVVGAFSGLFGMALRDGDVLSPVPEPGTYLLLVVGILAIASRVNLSRQGA